MLLHPTPYPTRLIRLTLTVMMGFLLASCSGPAFSRAWKEAQKQPSTDPICGQWTGTWQSEVNGHHGSLQCVVSPPSAPGQPHDFFYRATWKRILSGSYRAKHKVEPSGQSTWTLSGEHQMPSWAGGLYTYKGRLTPETFSATYDCNLDRGTYSLRRLDSNAPLKNTLAKTNSKP